MLAARYIGRISRLLGVVVFAVRIRWDIGMKSKDSTQHERFTGKQVRWIQQPGAGRMYQLNGFSWAMRLIFE